MGSPAIVIDPQTGERVQSVPIQIDPATGERVGPSAAAPPSAPGAAPQHWWTGTLSGTAPWQQAINRAAETTPYSAHQGVAGNAMAALNNLGAGAVRVMFEPMVHPVDTALSFLPSLPTPDGGTESLAGYTPPPAVKPTWGQAGADLTASLPGAALMAAAGPEAGSAAASGAKTATEAAGNAVRRAVAGDVNAPMAGTEMTPMQRFLAMRETGMQPDAAQATNSPVLNAAKAVNRNSITSSSLYDSAQAGNTRALNDYTENLLNTMAPKDPEAGGAAVQQGLLQHQADLKAQAEKGFSDLDEQLQGQPIMGAPGLRAEARRILTENAPYYDQHPELEPRQAMSIVRDLAGASDKAKPAPAVVTGFGPPAPKAAPAIPRDMTYTELHRLRSDLLDFNNNNPDLVKNQANGWIQRLAGAADQAITSPRGSLTPDQVQTFRASNNAWKLMKESYDSPQHPFYSAVRTGQPSTLVSGSSALTRSPEIVQQTRAALGDDGMGPLQRGVVERALGTTKEGNYNFRNFQGQWNKIPDSIRTALFTPEQLEALDNIGRAGTVLNEEPNPSGTAKLGQKMSEASATGAALAHPPALVPTAAYHAGQYTLGQLMTRPKVVHWLMGGGSNP